MIQPIPSIIYAFYFWGHFKFQFLFLEYEFGILWIATSIFCILIHLLLLIQCIISILLHKKDDVKNNDHDVLNILIQFKFMDLIEISINFSNIEIKYIELS